MEKSFGFDFRKFGLEKKVSILENLISEKSLGFGFGKLGLGKNLSVSVSLNSPLKPKFDQANKLQREGRTKLGKGTSNTWVKVHLF